ncbi:MAG: LrgB family protein [Polyangiales bacterium]
MRPWHVIAPIATVAIYLGFVALYKRTRLLIALPVVATPLVLVALLLAPFGDLPAYEASTRPFVWLLGPATVALAVPLARKAHLVRENLRALLGGVIVGATTVGISAVLLARALGLSKAIAATLGPKSVTTPIAMPIAERLGGMPALTAAVVIVTGVIGFAFGPRFLDRIGVRDEIARGVAFGTAAHGVGTAKAIEENEGTGAASGASMVIAGVITAAIAPFLGWLAWR